MAAERRRIRGGVRRRRRRRNDACDGGRVARGRRGPRPRTDRTRGRRRRARHRGRRRDLRRGWDEPGVRALAAGMAPGQEKKRSGFFLRGASRVQSTRRAGHPTQPRWPVRADTHRAVDRGDRRRRQTGVTRAQTGRQRRRRAAVSPVHAPAPSNASLRAAPQAPLAMAVHAFPERHGPDRG